MPILQGSGSIDRFKGIVNLVHSKDGGLSLGYSIAGILFALPVGSDRVVSTLAQIASEHLGFEVKRRQAKQFLESFVDDARLVHVDTATILPRVGGGHHEIEILLNRNRGKVARLNPGEVEIVEESRCIFYDSEGVGSLPRPKLKGTLKAGLKKLKRLTSLRGTDFNLVVLWLLAACRPVGPYPILILIGGPGSGKTTLTRCLKRLLDPTNTPVRSLPSNEKDLNTAARNNWLLAYDNVALLSDRMSDALCRLSSGVGLATRRGRDGIDEAVFGACRPIVLNGIDEFATRNDLIQRSIVIHMPEISTTERMTECEWNELFKASRGPILGTFLKASAHGLMMVDEQQLDEKPRMADFLEWAVATGDAFGWSSDKIINAFNQNQRASLSVIADSDPLLEAIQRSRPSRWCKFRWP